ncbi:class I SAM-dependent methyltransferase [Endozoicomonas atrinae]|uniref:class I SAM-dependent methyltransferase n=1 Tax=Endozoicomonas atrinae TaxID=1333660 RepID=UPI003AFFE7E1
MTSQSSRFVGSIPEHYDSGLGPHIFTDYAADIARRAADYKPSSVLELAAGTGIVTRKLRNLLPVGTTLLATDLSPPMLEQAKKKFAEDENVRFEVVDASSLPYDPPLFDVVVCQFGVMFFPDKLKSYSEVLRVLKPGGHYLFNVWDCWAANPFAEIVYETIAEVFPDDPPGFYRVPFGYHDIDAINASLREAGFTSITAKTLPLRSRILSAELLARGIVFGSPLYEEIVSRNGDLVAIHSRVQKVLESQFGNEMPIQAIVFGAESSP